MKPRAIVKTVVLYSAMILVIIFSLSCHVTQVLGESMAPTLEDGSRHLFLRSQEPEDGDIVIFVSPVEGEFYVTGTFWRSSGPISSHPNPPL